jgi:hypothetical protein
MCKIIVLDLSILKIEHGLMDNSLIVISWHDNIESFIIVMKGFPSKTMCHDLIL